MPPLPYPENIGEVVDHDGCLWYCAAGNDTPAQIAAEHVSLFACLLVCVLYVCLAVDRYNYGVLVCSDTMQCNSYCIDLDTGPGRAATGARQSKCRQPVQVGRVICLFVRRMCIHRVTRIHVDTLRTCVCNNNELRMTLALD